MSKSNAKINIIQYRLMSKSNTKILSNQTLSLASTVTLSGKTYQN